MSQEVRPAPSSAYARNYCVLRYPERGYVRRSMIDSKENDYGDPQSVDHPSVNQFPDYTVQVPYGEHGAHGCDCSPTTLTEIGLDNAPTQATFKGCGDCTGGGWGCCGCCIQSWSASHMADCCHPQGHEQQHNGAYCDPAWCPWSPVCLAETQNTDVASAYRDYCVAHPTDAQCLETCLGRQIQPPPAWCATYLPAYCQHQRTQTQGHLTDTDRALCACQTQKTTADECLWTDCVKARRTGQAWLSPLQQQHLQDDPSCTRTCQSQAPSDQDWSWVCPEQPHRTAALSPAASTPAPPPAPWYWKYRYQSIPGTPLTWGEWGHTLQTAVTQQRQSDSRASGPIVLWRALRSLPSWPLTILVVLLVLLFFALVLLIGAIVSMVAWILGSASVAATPRSSPFSSSFSSSSASSSSAF